VASSFDTELGISIAYQSEKGALSGKRMAGVSAISVIVPEALIKLAILIIREA